MLFLSEVKILHVTFFCYTTAHIFNGNMYWYWLHISGSGESSEEEVDCSKSTHGCCPDGRKVAAGPNFEGCDVINAENCTASYFGCCPDGVSPGIWPLQYIGWNYNLHTYILCRICVN